MHKPDLACGIQRPLDVLRGAVQRLDLDAHLGQHAHLVIRKAARLRQRPAFHRFRPAPHGGANADLLTAQVAFENRARPGIDHKVIGVAQPRHHGLAQARIGVDHGLPPPTGERVGSKEDAGHLGIDQALDDRRQLHSARIDAVLLPVADRPRGPE